MASRKRPRLGEKDTEVTTANNDIQKSNSTVDLFLAPAKKSWMTSKSPHSTQLNRRLLSHRAGAPHLSINTRASIPSTQTSASRTTPVNLQQQPGVSTGTNTHIENAYRPLTSQTRDRIMDNAIDRLAETNIRAPVLPSPAPSEAPEDLQGTGEAIPVESINSSTRSVAANISAPSPPVSLASPNIRDDARHMSLSRSLGPSTRPSPDVNPEQDRLRELAARYGGIEELEKQLEFARRVRESPHSNPQTPVMVMSPGTFQSGAPNNAAPERRSSLAVSATPATSSHLVQQLATAAAAGNQTLALTSRPEIFSPSTILPGHQVNRLPANIDHVQTVPQAPSMQASLSHNETFHPPPQSPAQVQRPSQPSPYHSPIMSTSGINIQQCEVQVNMRLRQCIKSKHRSKTAEINRLALLVEACRVGDYTYLFLHQLLCFKDLVPWPLPFSSVPLTNRGFAQLSQLLLPNTEFSPEALQWFSRFPKEWPTPPDGLSKLCAMLQDCLVALGQQLDRLRQYCKSTATFPSVELMWDLLHVHSPILQKVIFKAISRSIWPQPEDECWNRSMELFEQSQVSYSLWRQQYGRNIPTATLEGWRSILASLYTELVARHNHHASEPLTLNQPMQNDTVGSAQAQHGNNGATLGVNGGPQQHYIQSYTSQGASNNHSNVQPLQSNQQHEIQRTRSFAVSMPGSERRIPSTSRRSSGEWRGQATVLPNNQIPPRPPSLGQRGPFPVPINSVPTNVPANGVMPANPPVVRRTSSLQSASTISQAHHLADAGSRPNSTTNTALAQHAANSDLVTNALMFPPRRHEPQSNMTGLPLQHAYLRDPETIGVMINDPTQQYLTFFSYISGFLLDPVSIDQQTANAHGHFLVPSELFSRLPHNEPDLLGGPPRRKVTSESRLLRLRCIKSQPGPVPDRVWATSDTSWPELITVILNGQTVELRKKPAHHRDLAADISANVREGENRIRISLLQPRNAAANHCYALGIEILELNDAASIMDQVKAIEPDETEKRIRAQLANSSDDEIEIVSSDLVLKMSDPFSAQLPSVPVRGKFCTHYECFDLRTFLETRKSDTAKPEQFRCPICGCDARPPSLHIDNWFVGVLKELRSQGREDAKEITVNKDVKWAIKEEEKTGETGDGTGRRNQSIPLSKDIDVIELD